MIYIIKNSTSYFLDIILANSIGTQPDYLILTLTKLTHKILLIIALNSNLINLGFIRHAPLQLKLVIMVSLFQFILTDNVFFCKVSKFVFEML
jgi:hypothetical protein